MQVADLSSLDCLECLDNRLPYAPKTQELLSSKNIDKDAEHSGKVWLKYAKRRTNRVT